MDGRNCSETLLHDQNRSDLYDHDHTSSIDFSKLCLLLNHTSQVFLLYKSDYIALTPYN